MRLYYRWYWLPTHTKWSLVKSATRLIACVLGIPWGFTPFLIGFAVAEALGIAEELL